MRVRIKDFATPSQKDIDLEARYDAPKVDAIVNRCVAQVTDSLKLKRNNSRTSTAVT
jgi:hypothetical protein